MTDSKSELVWGAANIARVINRTERQTRYLFERGALPVTKVGAVLVGKESELRDPTCWPRSRP